MASGAGSGSLFRLCQLGFLAVVAILSSVAAEAKTSSGFAKIRAGRSIASQQILRLTPSNAIHVDYIQRLKRAASHRIDFWTSPEK